MSVRAPRLRLCAAVTFWGCSQLVPYTSTTARTPSGSERRKRPLHVPARFLAFDPNVGLVP